MTRRSRRASSGPQQVGSDAGLTSSRPVEQSADVAPATHQIPSVGEATGPDHSATASGDATAGTRHTPKQKVEQTKDDTDEGWGEPGDDDASGRWLRENRPPHWD